MDGIIHVFPFTCMPEIVAQNIQVKVSKELDNPVLTQIISEQTGEAGYQTRLEAFLDVLLERREYKTKQQERGKTIVFSRH
jgi:predicted nucleotide-binding protein (sugar kinase/HSP70/actin superfamily)